MNQLQKLPGWSGELPETDCENISVFLKNGKTIYREYGWIHSDGKITHIDGGGIVETPDEFPSITEVTEIPIEEILLITYRCLITDKIKILMRTTNAL